MTNPAKHRLTFGKFSGKEIGQCPLNYIIYLAAEMSTAKPNIRKASTIRERRIVKKLAASVLEYRWRNNRQMPPK